MGDSVSKFALGPVFAFGALLWFRPERVHESRHPRDLPIVPWDEFRGAAGIASLRRPVLVSGSPAVEWPALQRWRSLEYIAARVPNLSKVCLEPGRFIYRDSSKPIQADGAPPSTVNLTTREAFARMLGGDPAVYYSRSFARFALQPCDFEPLIGDVTTRHFELSRNARDPSWTREEWTQVWLGGGHITNAHYDCMDNFFVQIRGQRTFALANPSANFSVYPYWHEHSRQVYPGGFKAEVTVRLQPGDVLFLPAFTFHEVWSPLSDVSIGVNVFNTCRECDAIRLLRSVVLPRCIQKAENTAEGLRLRVAASAALLRAMFSSTGVSTECFGSWLSAKRVLHSDFEGSRCPRNGELSPTCTPEIDAAAREVAVVIKTVVTFHIERGVSVEYAEGVRDTLMGNYAEDLAAGVVGAQKADQFLRCLLLPTSWQKAS